jgi:hypothetical protein
MNVWNEPTALAAAAFGLLLFMMLIWNTVLSVKLSKLKKTYRKLIGDTGVQKLDDVIQSIHRHLAQLDHKQNDLDNELKQQERRLTAMKGNVGIHRFNAFSDSGSDLSFSLAIVNEEQDGVVLTGLCSRDHSFLYAKPIVKGQSAYLLSQEEKKAISLALHKE